ncbi:MAG: 3-dehydroquinate synthase, partial [Candidatus Omnitrophica bacterium]|nr:3-dehydroquinate synthase [Candidatus Omnitrophota bacterium]
ADEHEKLGYRSILNFGHTIGHAIEVAASYKKSISHGEAVCVGMLCAFDIAVSTGMAKEKSAARIEALIKRAKLPVSVRGIDPRKVLKAALYDKKIVMGKRRWVLPCDIGHVVVCTHVPGDIIKQAVLKRVRP